jgi:hypothetical protein
MWLRALCIGFFAGAVTVSASAQIGRATAMPVGSRMPSGSTATRGNFPHSIAGGEFSKLGRRGRSGLFLGGSPLWWDEPYPDSPTSTQVLLMPSQSSTAEAKPAPSAPPQDPLVIELRGDRYVRVSSKDQAGLSDADHVRELPMRSATAPAQTAATSMLPTIFVFRDGHREESSDYSIVSGIIYAKSEYWTDGAWTKQIPLSDLNIPESRQVNQERGVKFVLPAAPNEVVTRP